MTAPFGDFSVLFSCYNGRVHCLQQNHDSTSLNYLLLYGTLQKMSAYLYKNILIHMYGPEKIKN